MADKTRLLRSSLLNRMLPVGAFIDTISVAIAATDGANGDRIQLATMTRDHRLITAFMAVDATLGAGCTLKLQRDRAGVYTDITIATTAAGASVVSNATTGAIDLLEGDIITALIGGANIAAAAGLKVDLLLAGK